MEMLQGLIERSVDIRREGWSVLNQRLFILQWHLKSGESGRSQRGNIPSSSECPIATAASNTDLFTNSGEPAWKALSFQLTLSVNLAGHRTDDLIFQLNTLGKRFPE